MNKDIVIIGGGLAGLIAAHRFPNATVWEAAPKPVENHRALLRFRSDAIADLTGIPFKEVRVRKGIFYRGSVYNDCTITMANMYSLKVTGQLGAERSIWNLASEQRWIAPDDFYWQLVEKMRPRERIRFGKTFDQASLQALREAGTNVISTAPISVNLAAAGVEKPAGLSVEGRAIVVHRFKLSVPTDIYQTIYFPDPATQIFRASITGDSLIIERNMGAVVEGLPDERFYADDLTTVCRAFGLGYGQQYVDLTSRVDAIQKNGKIVGLDKADREGLLHLLSDEFDIYSLGRFATWRNVLLDDLIGDMNFIERLMSASDYGRKSLIHKR